jgi:DNA-binding transcriptional LysR family regulator
LDLFVAMRTFVAIVRTGSMNAAGHELGVSGALVGQRLSALEDRLQARLLNRSTRQQSLTEFGGTYLQHCIDILDQVALSEGLAGDPDGRPRGRLRITAPTSFGAEALMPALGAFRAAAPDVELDIVLSDRNLDLIPAGVDLAFRIGVLEDSALVHRPLAPYRMRICASPAYLAKAGVPHHPDDLTGHEAVLFALGAGRPWRMTRDGETLRWTPSHAITVNSGHAMRNAIRAGLGLGMLPAVLVQADIQRGTLVPVLEDWQLPERPMSLLYHRDRHMPLRTKRFIAFALSKFA